MISLFRLPLWACAALLLTVSGCVARPIVPKNTGLLRLTATIPLPHVRGRIDHLALDARGRRLFVAALGNHTVEVVDLKSRKVIHVIPHLRYPQGLAYVPDLNRLIVATAGDGKLRFYNAGTFQLLHTVNLKDDADDLRYQPGTHTVFVGYGNGAIDGVDVRNFKITCHIPVAGHPEAFEVGRTHIYVNAQQYDQVQQLNRSTQRVTATWKLHHAAGNFPLAYDAHHHRLFIGCRQPNLLLVLSSRTGREIARFKIGGTADDMYFDPANQRVYIACGAGVLEVFHENTPNSFALLAAVPTTWGGRTSLLDDTSHTLYLAIPHHGSQRSTIRVYAITH